MSNEQKEANAQYRASHPIPANETADAKVTREVQEKADKASGQYPVQAANEPGQSPIQNRY